VYLSRRRLEQGPPQKNVFIFTTAIFDLLAWALGGYYVLSVVPPDGQKCERPISVTLVPWKGTVFAKRAYMTE